MSQHSVHRCLIRCPHCPYICPQMSICLSTIVPISCPQMSRDAVHRAHDHVHRCPMIMSTDVQASCPHCPCFCPHMSKGGVHICPRCPMLLSTCCPHMSKDAVHRPMIMSTDVQYSCPQMSKLHVHIAHAFVHICPKLVSTYVQGGPCFCPHAVHICPRSLSTTVHNVGTIVDRAFCPQMSTGIKDPDVGVSRHPWAG